MASENGQSKSYYASTDSNLKNARPGQPIGRQERLLVQNPTREWVRRNAPNPRGAVGEENFFFSGTAVMKSVGRDEGLTGVRCMAIINDRVWVGEREGCFSVWDFRSGERLFRSTKKKDIFVWCLLGPVNGHFAWVGTSDSFVRIFNAETMELVKEMKEHVGGVYCLAETPGSRLIFSGSNDFTIVKWDGLRGERLAQFNGHRNNVRSLVCVGKFLFSGSDDCTIKKWDAKSGTLLASWEHHTGGVHAMAFASGKYLWSASEDKTIRIWDLEATKDNVDADSCFKIIDYPHTGQINCLTLIGSMMWSSSWNIVFVWDPETMELKGQYKCHEGCINALLPVHQSVVSRVWSASNDGVINMWDTECAFRNAISAASDGRLEELLVQLEEAQGSVEAAKKKTAGMEQICIQLNGEKDRLKFAMQSQQDKADMAVRDLRRKLLDADAKNIETKQKLEQLAADAAIDIDVPDVLAAFENGMRGSGMPSDWDAEDGLSQTEKDRRAQLRDAYQKGRDQDGGSERRGGRQDADDVEALLKNALENAYRNGDTAGAARLRQFLDD
eukprot:gene2436-3784_t